jgi:hypothetical protein
VDRISIRYMSENPVAKPFSASSDFVEVGRDRGGEVIAVLKLYCPTLNLVLNMLNWLSSLENFLIFRTPLL